MPRDTASRNRKLKFLYPLGRDVFPPCAKARYPWGGGGGRIKQRIQGDVRIRIKAI